MPISGEMNKEGNVQRPDDTGVVFRVFVKNLAGIENGEGVFPFPGLDQRSNDGLECLNHFLV